MVKVKKLSIRIEPSSERMLIRPFVPGNSSQVDHILFRIFSIPVQEQEKMLKSIYDRINMPYDVIKSIFIKHFEYIKPRIPSGVELNAEMQEFIGAYFSQQYSLESTALFNPSIVMHPVQHKKNCVDFILSLRAIGEGHISSITFREGEINSAFNITLKKNSPVIYEPAQKINFYDKDSFIKEFDKSDIIPSLLKLVFDFLPKRFSLTELKRIINKVRNSNVLINNIHNFQRKYRNLFLYKE